MRPPLGSGRGRAQVTFKPKGVITTASVSSIASVTAWNPPRAS
jgi:hypothetical protein